jgi:hypothetical protein
MRIAIVGSRDFTDLEKVEQAVEFAGKEQIEDVLAVGNDALTFAKYSDAGYTNLYLVGLLCQASLLV